MVKQRMGVIDVAAEVASLRAKNIQGLRLVNIYDINSKTYLLKLARSGEDGEKILLLIESGSRFHTIDTIPDKAPVPSNFTMKLRKHIRTRRLEDVQQLGVDRIVRFTFGTGDKTHYLILELYDKGNIILVDEKYTVLSLLRSHLDNAKGVAIMPGYTYAIQTVRLRERISMAALETAFTTTTSTYKSNDGINNTTTSNNNNNNGQESSISSSTITLKEALGGALAYGTIAIIHCCLSAGLNPDRQITGSMSTPLSANEKDALLRELKLWDTWLDRCSSSSSSSSSGVGGVILTKSTPLSLKDKGSEDDGSNNTNDDDNNNNKQQKGQYDEYHPLLEDGSLLAQYKAKQETNNAIIFSNSFDDAVKEFYAAAAEQRAVTTRVQREHAAIKKLEAIKEGHKKRLESLEQEAKESEIKAVIIECNLEMVDAAMNAVRDAVSAGMDWAELDAMIKEEKKGGNPVAALVDSLELGKNKITVLLPDLVEEEDGGSDYGSDEEEKQKERAAQKKQQQQQQKRIKKVKIQLDLSLSAYANARAYYDIRRKQLNKQQRTIAASKDALKTVEHHAAIAIAKEKARSSAQAALSSAPARKPHWFEKFHWFISSENYLVLSGRDAQQNELLVKRYLKKGDVYVHADLHGASSTIIKNHQTATTTNPSSSSSSSSQPPAIPPLTLAQAGQACICRSAAWDAKIVTSAWWVHHDQVSKTAPNGEYLVTGSFMIRGKKNYLPPQPLVMGFGFMFKLDEESLAAHLGERAPRGGGGALEEERVEEEEEEEEEEEKEEREEDGADEERTTTTATTSTAYEAFMNASVDTMGQLPFNSKQKRGGSSMDRQMPTTSTTISSNGVEDITASFSKYGLSASGEKRDDDDDDEGRGKGHGESGQSKRHLSAKERQLMKKKDSGGGDEVGRNDSITIEQMSGGKGKKAQKANNNKQEQELQPPMGIGFGKGKINLSSKKAQKKKKYRHQDEEEREVAMAMLQSAGQKKDKKTKKEERKARMAAKKAGRKAGYLPQQNFSKDDIARLTAQLLKEEEEDEDGDSEDEDEDESGVSSDEEERQEGPQPLRNKEKPESTDNNDDVKDKEEEDAAHEKAEVAALLAEENLELVDEEDLAKLSMLDTLTGNPRSEDTLLYAIPVCAPYSVLSSYKHRVKLVPGTLKKGKAVRQATEVLMKNAGEGRERDLMRGCPEQDGINLMVSGSRLQTPGLQKMQQAKRQKGKNKKGGGK